MMTKTILLFTVASVLVSNVVCSVVSDIQVFTDDDELAALDPEDLVTRVEITNERTLETSEPADRYKQVATSINLLTLTHQDHRVPDLKPAQVRHCLQWPGLHRHLHRHLRLPAPEVFRDEWSQNGDFHPISELCPSPALLLLLQLAPLDK